MSYEKLHALGTTYDFIFITPFLSTNFSGYSNDLKSLLRNSESLRNLLKNIDSAPNPNLALKNAMSDADFEKFSNICLNIVQSTADQETEDIQNLDVCKDIFKIATELLQSELDSD